MINFTKQVIKLVIQHVHLSTLLIILLRRVQLVTVHAKLAIMVQVHAHHAVDQDFCRVIKEPALLLVMIVFMRYLAIIYVKLVIIDALNVLALIILHSAKNAYQDYSGFSLVVAFIFALENTLDILH